MCALLTVTGYAKRIGKSHQYVSKAIQKGIITAKDGKIDPKVADRELKRNRPGHAPTSGGAKGRPKKKAAKRRTPRAKANTPPGKDTLQQAALRKARAQAELEEMKAAKERGELVNKAEALSAVFGFIRFTRDSILRIPARISSIVAAETNEIEVRKLLDQELRLALSNLAEVEAERILTR